MSLLDQTVSSQTKSLWHQRAFLLLWIASSTGYLARLVVRLALPLVAIRLTTSPLLVSGVTFALAVSHSQLGVQKEARLLVLHLLVIQVERKDVSWSTRPSPIAVCS